MSDLIYSYTRAQAIDDGILIDVSELAKEAGFRYPVAMTRTAWSQCVEVHADDVGQDEIGRLWDVLNVLRHEIRRGGDGHLIAFDVLVAKCGRPPRPVSLKSHCGPGDSGEALITIMLPDED